VITDEGVRVVKDEYKYKSGSYTPIDNFLNGHLWEPASKLIPKTVAPNMVTLTGLLCLLLSCIVVGIFSPDLKKPLPSYVLLFVAICQFIYQTFDALDGKHARNTGSSSALGQLFDHGCDSLGTVLTTLPLAVACELGSSVWTVILLFAVQAPFFLAQWEEYHTHVMRTCTGYIGVTEGQLLSMLVILLGSILGSNFWATPVSKFLPSPLAWILNTLTITTLARIAVLGVSISNSWLVYHNLKSVSTLESNKRQNSFVLLVPLITLMVCGILYQGTTGFQQYPVIAFATIGFVFSHLTTQIIVKSLTHEDFPILQWSVVPLPFIVLNSYLPVKKSPVREDLLLFVYFLFVVLCLSRYIFGVIDQLTRALNIYCLKLGARDKQE